MEPALIAVIGAVVGILLTNGIKLVIDARARTERVRDIQTALRAEIRSHRQSLANFLDQDRQAAMLLRLRTETGYSPFPAREVQPFVFNAILSEIHLLPGEVIDRIVLYYRQWQTLASLGEDMRDPAFAALSQERKAAFFEDYQAVGLYTVQLGTDAVEALNTALKDADHD